jgi:hypothetical protein
MMENCWYVFILIVLCVTMGTAIAQPPTVQFVAPLSGDEEVPPVHTPATGFASFQLNDNHELDFTLIVANLEHVTQAHIHCGAAGVNGPVVAFLFEPDMAGVSVNGILSEGTLTAADVLPRPNSPECPGGVADFANLIAQMRSGYTYVNIPTLNHFGGEIRGQIIGAGLQSQ